MRMNKAIKTPLVTLIAAITGIVAVICYNFFVSHISFLFMGMVLGATIEKHSGYLEKWAKKKLENPYA